MKPNQNKNNLLFLITSVLTTTLLCACTVGPDYKRPPVQIPMKFKEAKKGWKMAKPQDNCDRGKWWKIFNDPQLDALENQLIASNQTVQNAAANYQQALALVDEARASYFPTLSGSVSITRQRQGASSFSSTSSSASSSSLLAGSTTSSSTTSSAPISSVTNTARSSGSAGTTFTSHSWLLNATWEPDIWGSVHRTVEAGVAGAQASGALLALTRLSAEASLAQYYFELRGVDNDQRLLNKTVFDYKKSLKLTQNQYKSGVAARVDVVQAQSQLESAEASALNNGIIRAQYEHAIAVLIGQPPENFSISAEHVTIKTPRIPLGVPSLLLERRPDIAQAERLMAQANAQIGIAVSAYFPSLTLSGATSMASPGYAHWFAMPDLGWSIGPQLAETFFDGGLRSATVAASRANYKATIASYRAIVLAAFQDVEDNLSSLRILQSETLVQNKAAADARLALKLVTNQYKAGTVAYSNVITAQIAAYNAEKIASDSRYLEMTSAVGLVKALGGGWDTSMINDA